MMSNVKKLAIVVFAITLLIILPYRCLRFFMPASPPADKPLTSAQSDQTEEIILFFADQEGRLIQEERSINRCAAKDQRIKVVLEELRKGSFRHFERLLPPQTAVHNVWLVADTAIIDLSEGFVENLPRGSYAEMMAVYSMVNSICATMSEIRYVKLNISNNRKAHLKHLDLREPLEPDFGL